MMKYIDTHSHIYLDDFDEDLPQVIERARSAGVSHIILPNIDSTTITRMLNVCTTYKAYCYPTIGLHPTSVKADYEEELKVVEQQLESNNNYVAIGEVGLDLYWDKTYLGEQLLAFDRQVQLALQYKLPLIIHNRDALDQIVAAMEPYKDTPLKGVFHSFTGTVEEVQRLLAFEGFMIGINGVVTFKNSQLSDVLKQVPLERIVLETDAPYLTPVPNRGKRNESANLKDTLAKIAEVYEVTPDYVAEVTTNNALKVFAIPRNF